MGKWRRPEHSVIDPWRSTWRTAENKSRSGAYQHLISPLPERPGGCASVNRVRCSRIRNYWPSKTKLLGLRFT